MHFSIRKLLRIAIFTLTTAVTHVSAAEADMQFSILSYSDGNCKVFPCGSKFIYASGVITPRTPQVFLSFYRNVALAMSEKPYGVLLNSPGGSLTGGIQLGQLFRSLKLNTAVFESITGSLYPRYTKIISENGSCQSACAYAFMGGILRSAEPMTIGLHRFYRTSFAPSENNQLTEEATQIMLAELFSYASQMGVDAAAVSIASRTSGASMTLLNEYELKKLGLNNSDPVDIDWNTQADPQGNIIIFAERMNPIYQSGCMVAIHKIRPGEFVRAFITATISSQSTDLRAFLSNKTLHLVIGANSFPINSNKWKFQSLPNRQSTATIGIDTNSEAMRSDILNSDLFGFEIDKESVYSDLETRCVFSTVGKKNLIKSALK